MTDCSRDPLTFSRLGAKAVVAGFQGGRLTTDAGALLLRQVERRLGLFDALDAAIPDPRRPELIEHDRKAMPAQRITAIAPGYEDLNDHHAPRADPALQVVVGRDPAPGATSASPSTLCRLENRADRDAAVRVAAVLIEQFVAGHAEPPEAPILDSDATDDPVHGEQEGRFFRGYSDQHCFLPLYAFCGDELLVAYLRPGDIDAAKHGRAILKLVVQRLRAAWPDGKITIRADSGFCRRRTMRRCDRNGIGYVLGLAKNAALGRAARDEVERPERPFRRTGHPRRALGSFAHAAGAWDRRRRVIVKAEPTARGPNPRSLVTDVPGDPQELDEEVYCRRGEAEDRIKEQPQDLFADRTSCPRLAADRFRPLPSSAAYLLVQAPRRTALAGTERAEAQVGTVRRKRLRAAARVAVSVRRVVSHPSSSYPPRDLFGRASGRLLGGAVARAGSG